jgi:hypothetical protein
VGGQVAELLVTDSAAVRVRATDDVDIVVPVLTRTAYHRFGSRLRAAGCDAGRRRRPGLQQSLVWRGAADERGGGTYYGSADVEDIVTVVAGREGLEQDMTGASLELRHWLGARTATFLRQDEAADVIAGALPDAWGAPTTVAEVRKRFEALVGR